MAISILVMNNSAQTFQAYVSHYGIEKSKADVIALTNEAIDALSVFSDDADALRELAQMLTDRKN